MRVTNHGAGYCAGFYFARGMLICRRDGSPAAQVLRPCEKIPLFRVSVGRLQCVCDRTGRGHPVGTAWEKHSKSHPRKCHSVRRPRTREPRSRRRNATISFPGQPAGCVRNSLPERKRDFVRIFADRGGFSVGRQCGRVARIVRIKLFIHLVCYLDEHSDARSEDYPGQK